MLELQVLQGQRVLEQADQLDCKVQLELDCKVLLVLRGKWVLLELEFKEIMAQQVLLAQVVARQGQLGRKDQLALEILVLQD
jgi:hypothetical protein